MPPRAGTVRALRLVAYIKKARPDNPAGLKIAFRELITSG